METDEGGFCRSFHRYTRFSEDQSSIRSACSPIRVWQLLAGSGGNFPLSAIPFSAISAEKRLSPAQSAAWPFAMASAARIWYSRFIRVDSFQRTEPFAVDNIKLFATFEDSESEKGEQSGPLFLSSSTKKCQRQTPSAN